MPKHTHVRILLHAHTHMHHTFVFLAGDARTLCMLPSRAEWYRRQMFASQRLAQSAHDKELLEAQARIKAQRALASAQAQAAQRALSVAREKVGEGGKGWLLVLHLSALGTRC